MNPLKKILKSKKINPYDLVLKCSKIEALYAINECLEDFEINIDFSKFTKEELEKVFDDYHDCVIEFHPENYHQERGAINRSREIFLKHGLTHDDLDRLDFI